MLHFADDIALNALIAESKEYLVQLIKTNNIIDNRRIYQIYLIYNYQSIATCGMTGMRNRLFTY